MKKNLLPLLLLSCVFSFGQQVPDTTFVYPIPEPRYKPHEGPLVMIDAAHNNLHTRARGFAAFAKLLEGDGYRTAALNASLENAQALQGCKIFVIANALDTRNTSAWYNPTFAAFTDKEIETIVGWVSDGGSLLLIADHMPFAGAATTLARAFGFEYLNGFAFTELEAWPPSTFNISNQGLQNMHLMNGTREWETVDQVATFTGSAFRIPENAYSILSFGAEHYSLQPDTAWQFHPATTRTTLENHAQGAIMPFGKGRVAVFGEAAMFTAQMVNGNFKVGINSDSAPQNAQFVLNLIHWLDKTYK